MLSVYEGVILLTILGGMGDGHLDIFTMEVNNGVELLGCKVLIEQILQSVF